MKVEKRLPRPVLRRLPRYMILARELRVGGDSWASSNTLAHALGLTTSTVRQDLSHVDIQGIPKRGYNVASLESSLRTILRADESHATVVIGAGNMGSALSQHAGFAESGFPVCAVFDRDSEVVGASIGRLKVKPMKDLKRVCRSRDVQVGIIAVPAESAQGAADKLVAAGVSGILNLASVQVRVPEGVYVSDARLEARLQEIVGALQNQE